MKNFLLIICLALTIPALAGSLNQNTQQEIDHLFSHLENSGCQFNRNGSWYSAKEAASHLRDKYQTLLKKDMITNAESFIENVASKSSMTGTVYTVKCGNTEPVESGVWFKTELDKYRKTNAAVK